MDCLFRISILCVHACCVRVCIVYAECDGVCGSMSWLLCVGEEQSLMYKKLVDTQHRHRIANELVIFHINQAPPSSQGAGNGARTCDRRVPADLRADSQATVPPTLRSRFHPYQSHVDFKSDSNWLRGQGRSQAERKLSMFPIQSFVHNL
ncbi:hypothetical protein PoB_000877700 [Plakobranchus ocellatus]|uniref:Uncharacterized protein n=1 Tax=Plakobranchus ocellatus TaxID=259542 RepID=A0AAV3YIS2_9GAST|nr:hypothetical protein PoB_000877700 [Plakobranchus ocellatus]